MNPRRDGFLTVVALACLQILGSTAVSEFTPFSQARIFVDSSI